MKLDTYFERNGESGRAILPPAEIFQEEMKEREADRARMGASGWAFGSFAFVFVAVTIWAVA